MAVVLITGCSSGFGRAAAIGFAAGGHDVVATMRNTGKAGDLADVDGVVIDQLDVADPESRHDAVARTLDRFGRIDVLINNAGVSALGVTEEMPEKVVPRSVRDQLLRSGGADEGGVAVDARQRHRTDRQHHVDRRDHVVRVLRRLLRDQARPRRDLAGDGHRAPAVRDPSRDRRAGRVQHVDRRQPRTRGRGRTTASIHVRARRSRSTRPGWSARTISARSRRPCSKPPSRRTRPPATWSAPAPPRCSSLSSPRARRSTPRCEPADSDLRLGQGPSRMSAIVSRI